MCKTQPLWMQILLDLYLGQRKSFLFCFLTLAMKATIQYAPPPQVIYHLGSSTPPNHFLPLPLPSYRCSYSHMGAKSHQSLCQKDKDGRGFLWSPRLFHGSLERWGWKEGKISSLSARCWWPPDCCEHNGGHSLGVGKKKIKVLPSPAPRC